MGREKSVHCLSYMPQLGLNLQLRHVPRPEIKHGSFRFMGRGTPAKAALLSFEPIKTLLRSHFTRTPPFPRDL